MSLDNTSQIEKLRDDANKYINNATTLWEQIGSLRSKQCVGNENENENETINSLKNQIEQFRKLLQEKENNEKRLLHQFLTLSSHYNDVENNNNNNSGIHQEKMKEDYQEKVCQLQSDYQRQIVELKLQMKLQMINEKEKQRESDRALMEKELFSLREQLHSEIRSSGINQANFDSEIKREQSVSNELKASLINERQKVESLLGRSNGLTGNAFEKDVRMRAITALGLDEILDSEDTHTRQGQMDFELRIPIALNSYVTSARLRVDTKFAKTIPGSNSNSTSTSTSSSSSSSSSSSLSNLIIPQQRPARKEDVDKFYSDCDALWKEGKIDGAVMYCKTTAQGKDKTLNLIREERNGLPVYFVQNDHLPSLIRVAHLVVALTLVNLIQKQQQQKNIDNDDQKNKNKNKNENLVSVAHANEVDDLIARLHMESHTHRLTLDKVVPALDKITTDLKRTSLIATRCGVDAVERARRAHSFHPLFVTPSTLKDIEQCRPKLKVGQAGAPPPLRSSRDYNDKNNEVTDDLINSTMKKDSNRNKNNKKKKNNESDVEDNTTNNNDADSIPEKRKPTPRKRKLVLKNENEEEDSHENSRPSKMASTKIKQEPN
jgi:hypothetical protein